MVQPKCRDAGPDPQPGSCPCLPLRLHRGLQSSLRQVAQFIFLYLKQDFGSQGREASLRSAGWTPSRRHGITLLSKALLRRASFGVAFCPGFGADGGSARAAKRPLTSSASVGGSSGHPSWVLVCQAEVRPIISTSHVPGSHQEGSSSCARAERHHPILKASFLRGPRLLFPPVSITWPYSQLVKSRG